MGGAGGVGPVAVMASVILLYASSPVVPPRDDVITPRLMLLLSLCSTFSTFTRVYISPCTICITVCRLGMAPV